MQEIPEKVVQELRDLRLVWMWVQGFGGTMNEKLISLNKHDNQRFTVVFHGENRLREAAAWIDKVYISTGPHK